MTRYSTLLSGVRTIVLAVCAATTLSVSAHPGAEQKIEALSSQIATNPQQQHLFIQRGATYSIDGQFDAALADFHTALTLGDPQAVTFELGALYYRMGDFTQARVYFDEILSHAPRHAPALEYRARVLRDAGEYAAAVTDLQNFFALASHPNPGHYTSAANMLDDATGAGREAALHILDQGLEQLGLTPQIQQRAIDIERASGHSRAALSRLESLSDMLAHTPEWKAQMSELLFLLGATEQARQQGEAALQQLQTLKSTPARQRLYKSVVSLLQSPPEPAP